MCAATAPPSAVATGESCGVCISVSPTTAIPAIFAWHDHGNGANTPDASIQTVEVDVPGEGRFYAASKVEDNGNGTWRYTYAIYNLNSHRSAVIECFLRTDQAGASLRTMRSSNKVGRWQTPYRRPLRSALRAELRIVLNSA